MLCTQIEQFRLLLVDLHRQLSIYHCSYFGGSNALRPACSRGTVRKRSKLVHAAIWERAFIRFAAQHTSALWACSKLKMFQACPQSVPLVHCFIVLSWLVL